MAELVIPIITAVATAAVSITATYLKEIIPLRRKNKELQWKLEEPLVITRALAIGYFYNFLYRVGTQSSLEVRFDPKENRIPLPADNVVRFTKDEVEIVFVVPSHLLAESFDRVVKDVPSSMAHILAADIPGGYRVNYDIAERDGRKILVIKDAVRPYFVIRYYAMDCLGLDENSAEWQKLERDTLQTFEDKLLSLAKGGVGIFTNKISWKRIG